jgi:hypothetical protein
MGKCLQMMAEQAVSFYRKGAAEEDPRCFCGSEFELERKISV